ncbi:hypothetical protein DRQ33_02590 [bacterium]|nr:MAG: hypothetical protein DRQ33_02590 [bacterium]
MDADREGFLRSYRSLVQIAGRAARHQAGKVILYADEITDSMAKAIKETERRRTIQEEYNRKHNITPKSIKKSVNDVMLTTSIADAGDEHKLEKSELPEYLDELPLEGQLDELVRLMRQAAKNLDFEYAAFLRDQIKQLQDELNLPVDVLKKKKKKAPFKKIKRITRYY